MARAGRFVKPETVRLHLEDGESWIEVKKFLTAQEQRRIESYGMERMVRQEKKAATDNEEVEIKFDWVRWEFNRVLTYLVDWNFVREVNGKEEPVEVTRDALESLDPDTFEEIKTVLDSHAETMAEEKKVTRAQTTSRSAPGKTTGGTAKTAPVAT